MNETEKLIMFFFTYMSSRLVPIFTNQEVENIISLLFDIPLPIVKGTLQKFYKKGDKR